MPPDLLFSSVEPYDRIAHAALACYPVKADRATFLQHNGGVTFRVESDHPRRHFLLKIHAAAGTGESPRPEHLRARLLWLESLRNTTGMTVQTPVRNEWGEVVTLVSDAQRVSPYPCTLQVWVEGEPPGGHLTAQQVYDIGQMMARLHQHSGRWVPPALPVATMPDAEDSEGPTIAQALQVAVEWGILSPRELAVIVEADQLIALNVQGLPRRREVRGPIHGDLHHGNLLFQDDEVRPIDFDSMCTSPYGSDLGVTMYHILYQDPAIRAALLAGYQRVRALPAHHPLWLEEGVTWAAMGNLAFQVTIPEQRASPLLARNLRQLANDFCAKLIARQAFVLG